MNACNTTYELHSPTPMASLPPSSIRTLFTSTATRPATVRCEADNHVHTSGRPGHSFGLGTSRLPRTSKRFSLDGSTKFFWCR